MSPTVRPRPLLRWAPPLLLVLAAGLWAAAAFERWWPACRPGQLASQGCVLLQDHRYDYVAPSAPWEPVGAPRSMPARATSCSRQPSSACPSAAPDGWPWWPGRPLQRRPASVLPP